MSFFLSFSTNDETHMTTLTLPTSNKILLQSLSPFVKGLTIHGLHTKAKFHASSVMRFTEFKQENQITMKTIEQLIKNLTNQLHYLSKEYNHTFYRINPKDIIVIDFSQFLYVSLDDLMPITTTNTTNPINEIIFTVPFCKDYYISPELKEITSLPSTINAKTIYYSLGLFIIDLLYSFFSIKERKSPKTIPPQIKYTKLYWFLHKATLPNPKERHLLFV
jgi:hypothetical protein